MIHTRMRRLAAFTVFLGCLPACGGNEPAPAPSPPAARSLATFNTGTHPLLDLLAPSPVRETCDVWYGNDLCTTDAEEQVAEAVAAAGMPDVLLLQEIWDQGLCGTPGRPAASAEPPFVCSAGEAHQLTRVLPDAYDFACGTDVPGTRDALSCIAFRRGVFIPLGPPGSDAACRGRDCSDLVEVLDTACDSRWGKVIVLRGRTAGGPALLANVHLFLDLSVTDLLCQAEQVRVLGEALDRVEPGTRLMAGGDFNLDLRLPLPATFALKDLQADQGLELLGDTGPTNQLIPLRLDMIFTRDWPEAADASCQVAFTDPHGAPPMVDHGLVVCRRASNTDVEDQDARNPFQWEDEHGSQQAARQGPRREDRDP